MRVVIGSELISLSEIIVNILAEHLHDIIKVISKVSSSFLDEAAIEVVVIVESVSPVVTDNIVEPEVPKDIDVVDSIAPAGNVETNAEAKPEEIPTSSKMETNKAKDNISENKVKQSVDKLQKENNTSKEIEDKIAIDTKAKLDRQTEIKVTSQSETVTEKETQKPKSKSRKRPQSTSSNTSITEPTSEESKTPANRKRTLSNASNKSVTETDQKTPENVTHNESATTPSRRRAKTPSSTEVRKIITRRASKEMSEKLDDSKEVLDDSVTATPKRRSTRSRSKIMDDNESVASESSVRSVISKASEDAGDVKAAPIRKGRKSILSTKPDLSVIPEMITEEDPKAADEIISDYSSSRR